MLNWQVFYTFFFFTGHGVGLAYVWTFAKLIVTVAFLLFLFKSNWSDNGNFDSTISNFLQHESKLKQIKNSVIQRKILISLNTSYNNSISINPEQSLRNNSHGNSSISSIPSLLPPPPPPSSHHHCLPCSECVNTKNQ